MEYIRFNRYYKVVLLIFYKKYTMLHITNNSFYTCQPQTKDELRSIIIERIKDDGPECNLNDIDVSNITDMSFLFSANKNWFGNGIFKDFNGDVSLWDVSNVKNMNGMFYFCQHFNCDISKWDVSHVKEMFSMFVFCVEFNCDISQWNVSNLEYMDNMFYYCRKFKCDLSNWNVSNVENMGEAFKNCPTQPKWYDNTKLINLFNILSKFFPKT